MSLKMAISGTTAAMHYVRTGAFRVPRQGDFWENRMGDIYGGDVSGMTEERWIVIDSREGGTVTSYAPFSFGVDPLTIEEIHAKPTYDA